MEATYDLVEAASADLAAMRASLGLQTVRRYIDQQYWAVESDRAHAADELEPGLKLENVAAHSWQVADAALLIAPHFPQLRLDRALQLAILHDKLELLTGDFDPTGSDGQGAGSHVFDAEAQHKKVTAELAALELYLDGLREQVRTSQRELMMDIINAASEEARFIKAIDKLQALTYVLEKKDGTMSDEHIVFSIKYSSKSLEYFPGIKVHFGLLLRSLLERVAERRNTTSLEVVSNLSNDVRILVDEVIR